MLQGIVNISTNTEHSEIKKDYKLHGKHRAYLNNDSSNDLIVISPAFKYLAKLNWKVESINVNETDKIVISFSVLDFIFKITIDLKLLPHLNKAFFEVKKKIESKSIALIFSVPFVINENENLENFELSNLAILFSRFNYLVRTNEINPLNNKVSFGLYEDLVPGLKEEFQKVLYALLIFVEKLTSKKILEKLNSVNRNNPFETIRLENVEVR